MRAFVFKFRYRNATIKNKDEDFINSISFKIVDAFNIDKTRDNSDLKKKKKIILALFFLDVTNLDIVFL